MNFRLLSDTPIAPAGRRLSGADIFAPPAEVCGTDFPLLPSLLGVAPGCACVVTAFLNCFLPIFLLLYLSFLAPCFSTSTEFLQVTKPKTRHREPLPDCIGAGGLSLSKFLSNPIINWNARNLLSKQSYKKTPVGKK